MHMSILKKLGSPQSSEPTISIGLLLLRISIGAMMLLGHGYGKLLKVMSGDLTFADPLGMGAPLSLILATSAEFACAFLIIIGLWTRFAAIPVIITMLVAVMIVHADDPWNKKEFALLYLMPFLAILFTGAGKFSLDSYRK